MINDKEKKRFGETFFFLREKGKCLKPINNFDNSRIMPLYKIL